MVRMNASVGMLTNRSFISRLIIFIRSLICIPFSSSWIYCEFFVSYEYGKLILYAVFVYIFSCFV